jgi:photosystem II stability/assembly factor-like uncharacterized protein
MTGQLLTGDEVYKNSNLRTWYKSGGRRYFYGMPGYHYIDGGSMNVAGTSEPIYVPDPRRPGKYRLIARTQTPPDADEFTVNWYEGIGGIPRPLIKPSCPYTFYELRSKCADPSDFYRGWESYVMIYSQGLIQGPIELGTRTSPDADDPLTDGTTLQAAAIYPAGALSFGEEAQTDVVVEVIDVVYGPQSCVACGDGSEAIYALTRANVGSPAAPGQLIYSTDGGATWTTATITGIGTSAEPRYLDIAGGVLFVGTDATTLFYTQLNTITGAPGTWSTVTLPAAMTDVYVQSPTAIYFTGASGTIYKTTDIATAPTLLATVGASNLARIHGNGETVVAVGATGQVVYSLNGGTTWTDGTNTSSDDNTALFVVGPYAWWVGDDAGNLFKTEDGGISYTQVAFPGSGSGTVFDILFATVECGWIAHQLNSVARLVATLDEGDTWAQDGTTSRIVGWPTFEKAGRLAAPTTEPRVAANYLAVAGLATGGTDGVLIAGAPTIV